MKKIVGLLFLKIREDCMKSSKIYLMMLALATSYMSFVYGLNKNEIKYLLNGPMRVQIHNACKNYEKELSHFSKITGEHRTSLSIEIEENTNFVIVHIDGALSEKFLGVDNYGIYTMVVNNEIIQIAYDEQTRFLSVVSCRIGIEAEKKGQASSKNVGDYQDGRVKTIEKRLKNPIIYLSSTKVEIAILELYPSQIQIKIPSIKSEQENVQ